MAKVGDCGGGAAGMQRDIVASGVLAGMHHVVCRRHCRQVNHILFLVLLCVMFVYYFSVSLLWKDRRGLRLGAR